MSAEILLPPLDAVLEAHARLLDRYGGASGLRDPGGLEAALARPDQLRAYADTEPTLFTLAAALGYAIARIHHPSVDGDKRVAFFTTVATLHMNGWTLDAAEMEAAEVFEEMAGRKIDEVTLAAWLERHSLRRDP